MTPDEIQEEKEEKEDWLVPEGQLSVDVYQTKEELVIQSAIAGIRPDALDISLEGDVVTIRGKREKPNNEEGDYFTQECYWGQFSRDVILPVDVDPNRVKAEMKDGILTIRIPKIFREKKRKILVKKLNE
jgi:HSP20 family protein